ncbi:MAG: hypothetical protein IKO22_00295 [Oscillospiraceae bacterium]|nr:hypothetical protein [Oscillospiraceae bacterium]
MSAKNMDDHNRWRSVTVAFRMSPEEAEQLNRFVKLSGLSKQDYLIRRVLQQEVTVIGSSRVYKALREQMVSMMEELKRIETGQKIDDELLDVIRMMTVILGGMKKEEV